MAEISKITLPNGQIYGIKDEFARNALSSHLTKKVVTALPQASADTMDGLYMIKEESGDEDHYAEYLTIRDGEEPDYTYSWEKIGSTATELSGYSKTGHTHTYNKVSGVDAHSYTPAGTIAPQTFTGDEADVSVTGTPEGTVSKPAVTVTTDKTNRFVASSATGGGSVTAGSPATCTLPKLTFAVTGKSLVIGWSDGSFETNTPTAVTLPSFVSQVIVQEASASLASAPTFTGKELTSTGKVTPSGTIEKAVFSGTPATLSHKVNEIATASGLNSK